MTAVVTVFSVLTCLVSGWMGVMFLILRHQNYLERGCMSAVIFAGAAAMAAGGWRGPLPLRATLGVWAVALLALGLWALFGNGGDDVWVLVAGVLFVGEGAASIYRLIR